MPEGWDEPNRNFAFQSSGTGQRGSLPTLQSGVGFGPYDGWLTVERKVLSSKPWKAALSSPDHQPSYAQVGMNFSASAIVFEVPSLIEPKVVAGYLVPW